MSETLLFVPGLCADARLFMPQIVSLSRDMVVAVAPVARGDRIEEIASDILTASPARFTLCGHGLGGMVAMEIARRAPDRVVRMCLMDTSPLPETPQDAAAREPRIIAARSGRLDDAIRAELPVDCLAPNPNRDEIQQRYVAMAKSLGADVFTRQSRALQRRRDQQGTLRRLQQKVLLINGEYDTLFPSRRHDFMSELIPHASHWVIPDAGHLPMLEQANAVTAALRDFMQWPID